MNRLLVEAHSLQGRWRDRGVGRFVTGLVEELHRQGSLAAVLFDPELGPPSTHLDVPTNLWRPNTRRHVKALTARGDVAYLITSPLTDETRPPAFHDLTMVGAVVYGVVGDDSRTDHARSARRAAYLASLSDCDVLLTTSDTTRRDLLGMIDTADERIVDIGSGTPAEFALSGFDGPLPWVTRRLIPHVNRPHIMCVAGPDSREAVVRSLEGWSLLAPELRRRNNLVVSARLPDRDTQALATIVDDLGIAETVTFIGDGAHGSLRPAWHGARLILFLDRDEEFEFPPLEILATGVPALTVEGSALSEMLTDESVIDVHSAGSIAAAISVGLGDMALRERLTATARRVLDAQSWARTAHSLIDAIQMVGASHVPGVVRPRIERRSGRPTTRIALAGPFTPSRTGIGVYNSRLVRHLGKRCQLDCFVDGDWRSADLSGEYALPVSALGAGRRARDYDAVVSVLGNSRFHLDTYDAFERTGGLVWLHDVNVTGLHRLRSDRLSPADPAAHMSRVLDTCYGARSRRPTSLLDNDLIASDGFYMAADIAKRATAAIVSSTLASKLLSIDAGGHLDHPPSVLPLAFPSVTHSRSRDDSQPRPILVSMGNVYDNKRPLTLVEACALIPAQLRPRLVFAGSALLRDLPAFNRRVHELGLQDDVVITGWISEHEYWEWIRVADIVVQLRQMSSGESSATVVDAMAMGRVVVTSVAACADFPPGLHVQVAESIGAAELAVILSRYLSDPDARRVIEDASLDHSRSWTFDHVAAALVEIAIERGGPNG